MSTQLIRDLAKVASEHPETRPLLMHFIRRGTGTKTAKPWGKLPPGWTKESLEKYWKSLTGEVKHKVTKCIKEMEGKFDDPGAFCASLADQVDPGWRSRSAGRTAENWIQDAIKEPGRLHKYFGIPEDEDIPMDKLRGEAKKLKDKGEDKTEDEKSLQRAINMAINLKSKVGRRVASLAREDAALRPHLLSILRGE